jgi:hypothetical protein
VRLRRGRYLPTSSRYSSYHPPCPHLSPVPYLLVGRQPNFSGVRSPAYTRERIVSWDRWKRPLLTRRGQSLKSRPIHF